MSLSPISRERGTSSADRSGDVLARRLRHAAGTDHELRTKLLVVLGFDLVVDGPPCVGIGTQCGKHSLPIQIGIAVRRSMIGKPTFCDNGSIGILTEPVPCDRTMLRCRRGSTPCERCAKTEQDDNVPSHAGPAVRNGKRCVATLTRHLREIRVDGMAEWRFLPLPFLREQFERLRDMRRNCIAQELAKDWAVNYVPESLVWVIIPTNQGGRDGEGSDRWRRRYKSILLYGECSSAPA
ncbi:hypothetical protein ACVW16_004574 [Bradyrhizobium sp. USDA 4474]